jgi:hypothetical protein
VIVATPARRTPSMRPISGPRSAGLHRLCDKPALRPYGPLGPLGPLASHRARLGPHRALDTPGTLGPPPTYLRILRPEGAPRGEGGRGAVISQSSVRGSRPEIAFGPAFKGFDRQATCAIALLSVRRSSARAPEPCDELPPVHSITSSAMASRFGGMVRPSVLAVLRLMIRPNLVGNCTGRSPGFSPRRMRST